MSKKNKFEGIINDVGSFASNSNNNVDNSVVNTSNDVSKPVLNNITNDNATDNINNLDGITAVLKKPVKSVNISNVGSIASNTNMSIIVARRKRK